MRVGTILTTANEVESMDQMTAVETITISERINELAELRHTKKVMEADLSTLNKEIESVEKNLMSDMDDEGIGQTKNTTGSVTINERVVPHVKDWDVFWGYILKEQNLSYLHKRASGAICAEIWSMGKTIPGVEPYTKRILTYRET